MPKKVIEIEPWEQQPGETGKAFEAFVVYRDLGNKRSLVKTSQKLGKNKITISEWSSKYKWVERVTEYDRHLDRIAHAAKVKEVEKMSQRHINLAMSIQAVVAETLKNLKPGDVRPKDIANLVKVATELERLNRIPAAEEYTETEDDGFIEALSGIGAEVTADAIDEPEDLDPTDE